MLDVGALVAAEQVAEHHYGHLPRRRGNRGPQAAPQGVYACAETQSWVALAVATDDQWTALVDVLGRPAWALNPPLARAAGRQNGHDVLDKELAAWFSERDRDAVLTELTAAGVPATAVVPGYETDEDPQLRSRGFFEPVDHPVVGRHEYPGWPARLSGGPSRVFETPAPLLGQHNEEVLGGLLGLTPADLTRLRELDVIGERLLSP
jgi:crotonobetainyl-CoA:carnitine CoA-transferase CaiB-like acyl-CoA transferase